MLSRSQVMKTVFAFFLMLPSLLFSQSPKPASSPSALRITGSLTQCGKASGRLWVTFKGDTTITVRANESGVYEVDLPLGIWTAITVGSPTETAEYSLSRPRHFRVTEPGKLVLDLNLRPPVMCDLGILTPGGRPPTPEQLSSRDRACWGEEFFQVPSADRVPFEVDLFGLDHKVGHACSLVGVQQQHREFATYNLLTLQADEVAYDPAERTLTAHGAVQIGDESGQHKATSVTFYVYEGRAITVNREGWR